MFIVLLHRFKWLLILASGLSSFGAFTGIFMLTMISEAIDSMQGDSVDLAYSFSSFVAIILAIMGIGLLSQFILVKLSTTIVYEIQKTLLQRILATSYEKIERLGRHRVMATLEGDVSNLSDGLLMIPALVYNLVTVLLCFAYMLYSSWQLFLLASVIIISIIVISKIMVAYAHHNQTILREYTDAFFLNLQALTNGGKEINMNGNRRRNFYGLVMLPLFDNIRKKTIKSNLIFLSLDSFTSTLIFFLIGSIVYGAFIFLPGIETKVVVAFVLIILYLVDPLSSIVGVAEDFNEVRVSLRKIQSLDLADANEFFLLSALDLSNKDKWQKLRLENIQYNYPDTYVSEFKEPDNDDQDNIGMNVPVEEVCNQKFSIGPVSIEFNAGEVTFICGGNGSGKSTIVKLLTGLYTADSGAIYLDEHLVGSDMLMDRYKSGVSVIFSDFYIFDQLLNDVGDPADDEVIKHCISQLSLDDKVSSRNGVLSSTNLSQGQRKRLALLNSFVEDAHICVYDEWASDQDSAFKQYFYDELIFELKKLGKIVIVVSHDDQYFHLADRLIQFDGGLVVNSPNNHI